MKEYKIAVVGYGNVAQRLVKLVQKEKDFFREAYDTEAKVVAVCTRRKGALIDYAGIDPDKVKDEDFDKSVSPMEMVETVDYDILVELSTLVIENGQPATDHIKTAMNRGKHVVTANKGPIAWHYKELKELAEEKGVAFFHEAAVMDGTPLFSMKKETLLGCKVTEIRGILNATTNFILARMKDGISYEDAIKEGQGYGFVEADPTVDTDGWDATCKLVSAMNVLMDAGLTPLDVDRVGISGITREQILDAEARGKKIKLLCHGWLEDGKAKASVKPTELDMEDQLAHIDGPSSCIQVTTDLLGPISLTELPEEELGLFRTAYGVISDIFRIARDY